MAAHLRLERRRTVELTAFLELESAISVFTRPRLNPNSRY